MSKDNLKKLKEDFKRMEVEIRELKSLASRLEENLIYMEELRKENEDIKARLSKIEGKKPEVKELTGISIDSFLLQINKSLTEFEKGLKKVKIDKAYKLSGVTMEIRSFVEVEEGGNIKIVTPKPGEEIDPGLLSVMRFNLLPEVIPRDEEWIEVPNLIGMPSEKGKRMLETLGLKFSERFEKSEYKEGTIIDQIPEPYSEVKRDVKVTIVTSKGEK